MLVALYEVAFSKMEEIVNSKMHRPDEVGSSIHCRTQAMVTFREPENWASVKLRQCCSNWTMTSSLLPREHLEICKSLRWRNIIPISAYWFSAKSQFIANSTNLATQSRFWSIMTSPNACDVLRVQNVCLKRFSTEQNTVLHQRFLLPASQNLVVKHD